ncbi:unnamed protein product, partial [Ixodes persulcatus]
MCHCTSKMSVFFFLLSLFWCSEDIWRGLSQKLPKYKKFQQICSKTPGTACDFNLNPAYHLTQQSLHSGAIPFSNLNKTVLLSLLCQTYFNRQNITWQLCALKKCGDINVIRKTRYEECVLICLYRRLLTVFVFVFAMFTFCCENKEKIMS